MKPFVLLAAVILGLTGATQVLAQGRINFSNSSATPIRIGMNMDGVNVIQVLGTASTATFGVGPASAEIRLFAGLDPFNLSPVLIGSGANQEFVLNTSSTLAAAQGTFNGGGSLPLPGFDGSQPVYLRMSGIIRDAFSGFDWIIYSTIIQVTPATGLNPATTVFAPTADGSHWDGLLFFIPEPTSGTLLGVGLLTMYLARRRKQVT